MGELDESSRGLGPLDDAEIIRHLVADELMLFISLTDDATIAWISQSCAAMLGRQVEDLVGRNGLEFIHPDDIDVVAATMAEPVRNAEERILAVIRVSHTDGSWVTLEFGGIDLRDQNGQGTFLVWGRSYESAQQLTDFLGSLLGGTDRSHLLDRVLHWCDSLSPYSDSILLLRESSGISCAAASATVPAPLGLDLEVSTDNSPWQQILTSRLFVELNLEELAPALGAQAQQAGYHGAWCAPIAGQHADQADGLVISWRLRAGDMLATHRRHLQETARLSQLALIWSSNHAALLLAATTDSLTGLANRSRLEQAVLESSAAGALLFCDLDNFKALNDQYGHATGDLVLTEFARRLTAAIGPDDTLARVGGDEFALWCPGITELADAMQIGTDLVEAGRRAISAGESTHDLTCSVGVTLARRVMGALDLASILASADEALYQAKADGRNCVRSAKQQ